MKIYCDACAKELDEPGALLFSPPNGVDGAPKVFKWHFCVRCFEQLRSLMFD